MMKVGITGGIGSGKSTLCRLFADRGIAVYDSDAGARRLMEGDASLRRAVTERFGPVYAEGRLDRPALAAKVFGDPAALADLDALVHPAVRRDFEAWAARQQSPYVILESAILFEAGLEGSVDRTVAVLAPAELRIERVARRSGLTESEVRRRMAAQWDDERLSARADHVVVNIFEEDLPPAVERLDRLFRHEAAGS